MNLPIVLRPEAEADLTAAREWYDRQRTGLGDSFLDAVEELFARIGEQPRLYAVAIKNIRRGKLHRFPYLAYYRILEDRIEILGVLHGSRHPREWQSRT